MELKPNTQSSKTRKVNEKTVVKMKIEANGVKQRNEGPPSDVWSWRKYGQKPIKGSPYPRGYYKCSTSKGCLAKKQVERSKTDASMLLITYTCSHNHPDPDLQNTSKVTRKHPKQPEIEPSEEIPTPIYQEPSEDHFHYLESPSKDLIIDPFTIFDLEDNHELLHDLFVFDQDPVSDSRLMTLSTATKSGGNDFFDELGELPSTNFTSYMRSSLFDEGIVLQPY